MQEKKNLENFLKNGGKKSTAIEIESSNLINWQCKHFSDLTVEDLYKILQLRNEVFVVEQICTYQDCDGKDSQSYHVTAYEEENLLAYSRIIPPGISYPDAASIGRVVTSPSARKQKLGKKLMDVSLENLYRLFGNINVSIGAQLYLKTFYESFHFVKRGDIYLEDGIEHITMDKRFKIQ